MAQEARDKKEREKLHAAIEASSTVGRQLVDLDSADGYFPSKTSGSKGSMNGHVSSKSKGGLDESQARDARDEAVPQMPSISRPESPFTQHPTIDFDGLSWPSMHCAHLIACNTNNC